MKKAKLIPPDRKRCQASPAPQAIGGTHWAQRVSEALRSIREALR